MPDRHLTPEILEEALFGDRSFREVVWSMILHLLALCPECRSAWAEVALPRSVSRPEEAPEGYADAFRRTLVAIRERDVDLERERGDAPGLLEELCERPEATQRELLWRDRRFHTWGFCDALINASAEAALEDPAAAESLSRLAIALVDRLDPGVYGERFLQDVRALAWAYHANALRVGSDLKAADEALALAHELLGRGSGDPLVLAQVLDLEASLRRAQRRFGDSFLLLEKVIRVYRQAGDRHLEGRAMVKQACALREQGDAESALPLLAKALRRVDPRRDPRAHLCVFHNRLSCLVDVGLFDEAADLMPRVDGLSSRHGRPLDRLRLGWVRGKVAAGLGHPEDAESDFLKVRERFIELGIGYDAALVSLDLAGLYAARGETARVRRLGREMLPIFRSQDVHREAIAALLIFQQAAFADAVTVRMVEDIAAYLRRARRNPKLRFERPS